MKKEKNIYLAAKGREVMVFPGSTLFNKGKPWIVAAEMVRTSRLFARTAAKIDPSWLEALGGDLCRSNYLNPYWDKQRGEVKAYEQITLYGLVILSGRPVSYGLINPHLSQEIFIRSGLMEGALKGSFSFLKHNQSLIDEITSIEDRIRRRDILVGEDAIAEFYEERLGGVTDVQSLRKRIKEKGGDGFLKMRKENLMLSEPDEGLLRLYPDEIRQGDRHFQLSYRFAPGTEEDGITLTIPAPLAPYFPPGRTDWMVPGLFKEKITALIKGLPKRYRKALVPVSTSVDIIVREMEQTSEPLVTSLARFIYRRFGVDIPAAEWAVEQLPSYLIMRIAITDQNGREIRSDRDPGLLNQPWAEVSTVPGELDPWKGAREKWERSNLTSWDFGNLPEQIPLGKDLVAFPALEPGDGSVNIRLFPGLREAQQIHPSGVKLLYTLHYAQDLKHVKRALNLSGDRGSLTSYFGGKAAFEKSLYEALVQDLYQRDIRNQEIFFEHGERLRPVLLRRAKALRDLSLDLLHAYHQLRSTLNALATETMNNKAVQTFLKGIRHDLENLIPTNFLRVYSKDRLRQMPRYLKGMEIRVQRGANDLNKDRKKEVQLEIYTKAMEKMRKELSPHASPEKREAIEQFRWMVEEFKISLFAQELKTPYPVSPKRLQEKHREIERMV
jgi:ATP-dependent helicase HrpA